MKLPKPKTTFPYYTVTEWEELTANGCAFSSGLFKADGTKVGYIEQEGRGGADIVAFQFKKDRVEWEEAVKEQFDGNQEDATLFLEVQEFDFLTVVEED